MNIEKLADIFKQLRTGRLPSIKKIIILSVVIFTLVILIVIISSIRGKKETSFSKVTLMPSEMKQKKELDYELIKFDTIEIPSFAANTTPKWEEPKQTDLLLLADNDKKQNVQPQVYEQPKKTIVQPQPKMQYSLLQEPTIHQQKTINKNPNMIVMNNMAENTVQGSGSASTFTGMQSELIKVVLTDRTPVATGSVVEARVLKDSKWGNIFIPRRSKVIGITSLFSGRIHIEFREVVINNVNRPCMGRAYDSKRLLGISYSPVGSETKRAILDELTNMVSGVPVVGRVANKATYSSDFYNQDVSELDEGLEFYALIESIY